MTKTLKHNDEGRSHDMILYCQRCKIKYGRSVGYYLDVTGEMVPSITGIMENSPCWNKLMEGEKR